MKKIIAGIVLIIAILAIGGSLIKSNTSSKDSSPAPARDSYIALGDSVAAGVGLKTSSDYSACDRTNEAYPQKLSTQFNYNVTNLACSGATLTNGILGQQNVNQKLVTPQLDQLFTHSQPKLITLTIGANDANWTDLLTKCYTTTCGDAADNVQTQAQLTNITKNLSSTLQQISKRYGANSPQVVVTGYYQVFPSMGTCADVSGIDASELAWGRKLQADISTAIKKSVDASSFATFAPLDFNGHELCATDPWVQGLNDKAPYHPTDAGQSAIAKQIKDAL